MTEGANTRIELVAEAEVTKAQPVVEMPGAIRDELIQRAHAIKSAAMSGKDVTEMVKEVNPE